ncbi:sigma 54-interacting transcriptional regulator [Enterococcus sp. BWM-S5]|uniref:Sigma 54-interacting transcriptional regulator n=1 Tax=Enterococcus larvae TaxID=2794352 RepID=A0ABS4CK11_9ENTE|nr:sigma-54-dependent transcriptional regulator [Enterococcus larvae]MBP1046952.1 sigma 54-interacting transcriptional regulator [Enterococcus larvae]
MKRMELVYEGLKRLYEGAGITTNEVAEQLELSRANVSSDLNQLVAQGMARKECGKPVLYHPVIKMTELEQFVLKNPSLKMIVNQAQAAILYPPNGLNMLFYGETGVGKSMFVSYIYDYAKTVKRKSEDYPFIRFNCADYANNPQLLMGQLFGVTKNAYTGAEEERRGLIEKADGGILFLDEIHRLPPEGQEMLFTFIDYGTYNRLGETAKERSATVQLIAATTEAPNSALLQTFQRRIPMVLKIPSLAERTLEERAWLVSLFLQAEANRLNEPIKITQNSLRALISYHCPSNIGQLKSDVQLCCAKAYADFLLNGQQDIRIHSPELMPHILNGLYQEPDKRIIWQKMRTTVGRYVLFQPDQDLDKDGSSDQNNIYKLLNEKTDEVKSGKLSYEELVKIVEENYQSLYREESDGRSIKNLKTVFSEPLYETCIQTIQLAEQLLERKLNEKIQASLAIHLLNTYDRIRRGDHLTIHPDNLEIEAKYPEYVMIAKECLLYLNCSLDINIPDEEAVFLAMFFIYNSDDSPESSRQVQVIVLAHGASTATSMTTFVNRLLNVEQGAWGINMDLEESPKSMLQRLKQLLIESNTTADLLFLVDMGSLNNIGHEIEKELGNHCATIGLVSTSHVLEATRKAVLGIPLDEIYQSTLQVNEYAVPRESSVCHSAWDDKKESVILTFCVTGEGTAVTMKNILKNKLTVDDEALTIIPVTLLHNESAVNYLSAMQKKYTILCIVSSLPIKTSITQFQLYDLFQPEALAQIQEIVDIDSTYRNIGQTLKDELSDIDSNEIVADVKSILPLLEKKLQRQFHKRTIFGAIFHICCLVDGLKKGDRGNDFPDQKMYEEKFAWEHLVIREAIQSIEEKYAVTISDGEISYMVSLFVTYPQTALG